MANPNPAALVNQPPPTVTRKSITGFVTKLVGDGATYGFINDEIFFQQTNVADGPAGVNDRVFAECEYSAHLPIKWNATSIKILARAPSSNAPAAAPPGPAGILESDPRRQSRQGMMLSQQQQQHQQQQQTQLPQQSIQQPTQFQPQFSSPNQQAQQNIAPVANTYQQHRQQKQEMLQQPMGPASTNQISPFISPFGQAPMAQHTGEIPVFDSPMGPPKLEYTSQLGAAFVQNQMMPNLLPQQAAAPFMQPTRPEPQQPQQPQQQQQQHQQHQQHQSRDNNRRDQQRNQHNNKNQFNNDKNDRNNQNQNNRGRNRNDNKFDRGTNEREGSNSRSRERSNDSRDRENTKREGIVKRPSPSRNSSRPANSSERTNKSSKRHYDPHNIPRTSILTNMNAWNMRSRCPTSIHVPSDLKNIIVNPYLRLDIKNMPKPLEFKIEASETNQDGDDGKKDIEEVKPNSLNDSTDESQQSNANKKDADTGTPPSSKSDTKLNHKYGVKVVLISLPELETIYKKVFGEELDSYAKDSKLNSKLDETISLLCNTASNGGHSLIGGKFDSTLDGFVEGETNEFERHGRQPDLIATCRRVVQEQTGLDLGPCQSWTLVSTFMYNHKNDYFSPKASIEYSFIYMPNIWSMTESNLTDNKSAEQQSVNSDTKPDVSMTEENNVVETSESQEEAAETDERPVSQITLENLHMLRVADLKAELDNRSVTYKPNAKKAELVEALAGCLRAELSGSQQNDLQTPQEGVTNEDATTDPEDQLEEGEVVASGATTPTDEGAPDELQSAPDSNAVTSGKRKAEDTGGETQQDGKKAKKSDKVELIKEPFLVRPRKAQQQLSVVTLGDVAQVSRYDQFELSVTSNILKEALVQHLSEYIFTALVEDSRQRGATGDGANSSASSNSQETGSDSNDNNNNSNGKTPDSKSLQQSSSGDNTVALVKELPVDRYINLAFSYFDSAHLGYLQADDLSKLFCNTGLSVSKRALMSLLGDQDKFNYRMLADLSPKLAPTYVFKMPDQFNRLPGSSPPLANGEATSSVGKMIEFQGVRYNIEKLVEQTREAETKDVQMVERYNRAIENFDRQADEIHVLQVSQLSLGKKVKSLTEELEEARRECNESDKKMENLKKKLEEMLSLLKGK